MGEVEWTNYNQEILDRGSWSWAQMFHVYFMGYEWERYTDPNAPWDGPKWRYFDPDDRYYESLEGLEGEELTKPRRRLKKKNTGDTEVAGNSSEAASGDAASTEAVASA